MTATRWLVAAASLALGASAAIAVPACSNACDCLPPEDPSLDVGSYDVTAAGLNDEGRTVEELLPGLTTAGTVDVGARELTISYPASDGTPVRVVYRIAPRPDL